MYILYYKLFNVLLFLSLFKFLYFSNKKSCLEYSFRAAKDLEERRSHYEPSLGPGIPDDVDHHFNLEENDFVPHFQRVSISGEDTSGVCIKYIKFSLIFKYIKYLI